MRSRALSVVGSRPATRAGRVRPSGSLTATSPSSAKASSAVTMRPLRQIKPLECDWWERTETTAGAAPATRPTRAPDRSCNGVNEAGSVKGASRATRLAIDARDRTICLLPRWAGGARAINAQPHQHAYAIACGGLRCSAHAGSDLELEDRGQARKDASAAKPHFHRYERHSRRETNPLSGGARLGATVPRLEDTIAAALSIEGEEPGIDELVAGQTDGMGADAADAAELVEG